MASAIFAVPFTTYIGPDFSALGEGWLYYTDDNGVLCGGVSCIGHVPYPLPPTTCLVRVWSSPERIAEMATMPDYLFIEEVADAETPSKALAVAPPGKPPKPEKPTKAKARAWLKSRGHKPKDVDDAIDGANDVIDGLRALHGVTPDQYQAGKQ